MAGSWVRSLGALLLGSTLLSGCAAGRHHYTAGTAPMRPVSEIVVTGNPLASDAALDMLRQGGSPVDAAIAAEMVLGLVEPQSSGIGGGSLVLTADPAGGTVLYDGLAKSPAQETRSLVVEADGRRMDELFLSDGPRTVGVPGTLAALKLAHDRAGKLPWASLFEPAIRLARDGFPISADLNRLLSAPGAAQDYADRMPLYFGADKQALPAGTAIRNPAYADTLERVARLGPDGLYAEGGEARVLAALKAGAHPSFITAADLHGYRAVERQAACLPFSGYRVCTATAPSFGGIAMLQALGTVEIEGGVRLDPADAGFDHIYGEATRLAQADRRLYLADPDRFPVPVAGLIEPAYLRLRAGLISPAQTMPRAPAGLPRGGRTGLTPDSGDFGAVNSTVVVVDKTGGAVSLTSTLNLAFGAKVMVDGYLLNDALTAFAPLPYKTHRAMTIANEMVGDKRPVSPLTPVVAFDRGNRPVLVGGGAGDGTAPARIGAAVVDILANEADPASAIQNARRADPGLTPVAGQASARFQGIVAATGHRSPDEGVSDDGTFAARVGSGWSGAGDPQGDSAPRGQ